MSLSNDLDNLWQAYADLWQAYSDGKYDIAARGVHHLLLRLLEKVYTETKSQVSQSERERFEAYELRRFANTSNGTLAEWVMLFGELHIMDSFTGADQIRQLVKSFDLVQIANLSELSLKAADEETLKLNLAVIFYYITNLIDFTGVKLDTAPEPVYKRFRLDLSTGIMTNPSDETRNVSFKAVTFGLLLGHICKELVLFSKAVTIHDMNGTLQNSGYNAGSKFGETLSKELNEKEPGLSAKDKINRWCWFDTDVGWGRFENEIRLGNTDTDIEGKVILRFNFLTTNRGREDLNLCSFMKGYIGGVLEKLLGVGIKVHHDISEDCSQYSDGKNDCDFYISPRELLTNEVGK